MKRMTLRSLTPVAVLALAVMTVHCGGLFPAVTGLSGDTDAETVTCDSGDAECFQNSLYLVDEDGEHLDLVTLEADLPSASSSGSAPSITDVELSSSSSSMNIADTEAVYKMFLSWTDPIGTQTPGLCMQTCPQNLRCATGRTVCTRGQRDGLTTGVWRTWLGYTATPVGDAGTTDDLSLYVVPVITAPTADDPTADPIDVMEAALENGSNLDDIADQLLVGDAIEIEQQVTVDEDEDADSDDNSGGSSGNDEGTTCSSSSECAGYCLSTRSCINGMSCSCSGTSSVGTCYDVSSCSSAGGLCGDGVHACCVGTTCTNGTCVTSSMSSCY